MKHPRPRLFSHLTRGFQAAALVLGGFSSVAWAAEVTWLRILVDQAEPLTWRSGESMPSRPEGFPLEPSAVFSYTTLAPGQELDDSELAHRARGFQRALLECGRFSRAAVYVLEAGPEGARRGVIAEVEPRTIPGFGGGAAYASVEFPLVDGRRAALDARVGANLAQLSYRDDYVADRPIVFESCLSYSNDLLESGEFSSHEIEGYVGAGPRVGPLESLVVRARGLLRLEASASATTLLAFDAVLSGMSLGTGTIPLDSGFRTMASYYPQPNAARASILGTLRVGPAFGLKSGAPDLVLRGSAGYAHGALDTGELFDLGNVDMGVRGPDGKEARAASFVLGGGEVECSVFEIFPVPWLRVDAGPFAFAEVACAELDEAGPPLLGAGGGLRLLLGPPVNIWIDLGYTAGLRGSGEFLLSITSKPLF